MEAQANHSDVVDGILEGACDLHVLSAPDHVTPLRLDALDTARYAQEAGLGGFALLNDHNPTGPQAQMLNRVYPGLIVHGAVTLNRSIGGLNAAAVEAAAGAGARIVRMPTRDAVAAGGELSVLDGSGAVTSEAEAVLDAAARHGLVVASGGLSHSETIAVFRAACDRGVRIMLASYGTSPISAGQFEELTSLGAYIEHTFAACMPSGGGMTPSALAARVMDATVGASILTSGFGQWLNPMPAEGLRMAIASLLNEGLAPDELAILVKSNPARLLKRESSDQVHCDRNVKASH